MLVGILFIFCWKREAQARDLSSESQYQASVRLMPRVCSSPSACTSVMNSIKPASFIDEDRPNSLAALTELMVSAPPLASPRTCAPEALACNRKDEKSGVDRGWRTLPSTLPPLALTTSVVSFSSDLPKA